jgi:tetratricopeptide (TPR) repeat protein
MNRSILVLVFLSSVGCAHVAGKPTSAQDLGVNQLLQVAELAERSGDSLRAQQYLRVALQSGGDERKIVPRLLGLFIADGQYRAAIDQGEHHLRRHPDDRPTRLLLSTLYTAIGEDDHAVAQFEQVLHGEPNDAYAHFALASLLYERGGSALRADEHFRAYLLLEPHGEHAAEARGLLLQAVP